MLSSALYAHVERSGRHREPWRVAADVVRDEDAGRLPRNRVCHSRDGPHVQIRHASRARRLRGTRPNAGTRPLPRISPATLCDALSDPDAHLVAQPVPPLLAAAYNHHHHCSLDSYSFAWTNTFETPSSVPAASLVGHLAKSTVRGERTLLSLL